MLINDLRHSSVSYVCNMLACSEQRLSTVCASRVQLKSTTWRDVLAFVDQWSCGLSRPVEAVWGAGMHGGRVLARRPTPPTQTRTRLNVLSLRERRERLHEVAAGHAHVLACQETQPW